MANPNKTFLITVRLEPEVVERLDAWLDRQTAKPTRPQLIRALLVNFLTSEEAKEEKAKN